MNIMKTKLSKPIIILFVAIAGLVVTSATVLAVMYVQNLQSQAGADEYSFTKIYEFNTSTSFRTHMTVFEDKLFVMAKDSVQQDDNKNGKINTYAFDGQDWAKSAYPGCTTQNGTNIDTGSFSDLMVYDDKLYYGTYPRTAEMSYDGTTCRVLFQYDWGGGSTWQTASKAVYYEGNVYFVANRLAAEEETAKLFAFDPLSGDYPPLNTIANEYQKSDGRDSTQGPIAVFDDQLYFNNGIFQQGGYISVSNGGAPTQVDGSPNFDFHAGTVDELTGKLYLGGWNESTRTTAIYSYDGSEFTELKTISGVRTRPTEMIVAQSKLFVASSEPSGKPIMIFTIDTEGNATYAGSFGTTGYEAIDVQEFQGNVFALVHQKGSNKAEIWQLDTGNMIDDGDGNTDGDDNVDGNGDDDSGDDIGTPVQTAVSGTDWTKIYQFSTYSSFRARLATLNDNLVLVAKDPTQAEDNRNGKINTFTFDGTNWSQGVFPACIAEDGSNVDIGKFSDFLNVNDVLYFGTYPRTSFNSYDGTDCHVITSYAWGSGSTWQTASRGVLYDGSIFYTAHQMTTGANNQPVQTAKLFSFIPGADYPSISTVLEGYTAADGRDSSQGPLATFDGDLYLTHGAYQDGGTLGVFDGGSETIVDDENYNFMAAAVNGEKGKMYLGGWNEATKTSAIFSYDGNTFTEVTSVSDSLFRPTSMAIAGDTLLVVGYSPKDKPILTFSIDSSGNLTYEGLDGLSGYEITDLEPYNGKLYAIAHPKNSPSAGEVWVWQ